MSSLASLFTPATRDHLAMPDVQGSVGGRGRGVYTAVMEQPSYSVLRVQCS